MDLTSINRSSYILSEEIARWRFELDLRKSPDWWIAFTNPTAGPWKFLLGKEPGSGVSGEVLRFERETDRPDLVAVCDSARAIVIIEAKGKIRDLMNRNQIRKSCEVVRRLEEQLAGLGGNRFWGTDRAEYDVVPGILWGEPFNSRPGNFTEVAQDWLADLGEIPFFGVAVRQQEDGTLTCSTTWYTQPITPLPAFDSIARPE